MEKPDRQSKPLQLSIVITVYRGRELIEQTLESLFSSLSKSALTYEVILVSDSPEEDLEFLLKDFPEINLIDNEENLGVAKSRNRGRDAARGSIFTLWIMMTGCLKGFIPFWKRGSALTTILSCSM